jgi:hypothetical protein
VAKTHELLVIIKPIIDITLRWFSEIVSNDMSIAIRADFDAQTKYSTQLISELSLKSPLDL